jgi:hypothetical protein
LSRAARDFGAQVLAKIERGHEQDAVDVASFLGTGLVSRDDLEAGSWKLGSCVSPAA